MPDLKSLVRTIPDYPKKGILFRDVTTLLGHGEGFRETVAQMAVPYTVAGVQAVADFLRALAEAQRDDVGHQVVEHRGPAHGRCDLGEPGGRS